MWYAEVPHRSVVQWSFEGFWGLKTFKNSGLAMRDFAVLGPIRELGALGCGKPFVELDSLRPLVGLLDHVKTRSRQRIPDGPQLDFHEEEAEVVVGVLVEPLNRLTMLIAGAGNHPDDDFGAFPCRIRDDFA